MCLSDRRFQLCIITEQNLLHVTLEQICAARVVAIQSSLVMDVAFQEILAEAGLAERLEYRNTYHTQQSCFYLFNVPPMSSARILYTRRRVPYRDVKTSKYADVSVEETES